jgi:hypothetical protein
MAEEIQIAGGQGQGKIRNPLAPALLPFVTFGIYGLVWYYKINKEMAELGRAKNTNELGDSPGTSLLAITLGAFILVPAFVSVYNTWKRANAAEALTGVQGMEAPLGFLLSLFISPVGYYFLQRDLNNVLLVQAGRPPLQVGGGAPPPQVGQPEGSQQEQQN